MADPKADLDLQGIPCPLNFIRARLALEKIPQGAQLVVDLDRGEPEQMVVGGLRGEGHPVSVGPHPDSLDASFWIYLAHLPLCVIVPWAVSDLPMGAVGRFSISFVIVSVLLALSYEAVLMIVAPRRGS